MSRLKDIPEQTHEEYYLGTSEQISLKKFIPKSKPVEKIKGLKGAPKLSEDAVIDKCHKWMTSQGWHRKTLYTGGIPLKGGGYATNPAKGCPDKIYYRFDNPDGYYIEFKKSHGGTVSAEQLEWRKILTICFKVKVLTINSLEQLQEAILNEKHSNAGP